MKRPTQTEKDRLRREGHQSGCIQEHPKQSVRFEMVDRETFRQVFEADGRVPPSAYRRRLIESVEKHRKEHPALQQELLVLEMLLREVEYQGRTPALFTPENPARGGAPKGRAVERHALIVACARLDYLRLQEGLTVDQAAARVLSRNPQKYGGISVKQLRSRRNDLRRGRYGDEARELYRQLTEHFVERGSLALPVD